MKIFALVFSILLLGACVRQPTQDTQVIDDRPRITFDTSVLTGSLGGYEVLVDGISYGAIDQYRHGENALLIVPGRHVVEIKKASAGIYRQEVFLGERTTRVIKVVEHVQ